MGISHVSNVNRGQLDHPSTTWGICSATEDDKVGWHRRCLLILSSCWWYPHKFRWLTDFKLFVHSSIALVFDVSANNTVSAPDKSGVYTLMMCRKNGGWSLVVGLEQFLFSHILGIIIPSDFHIFQRGRYTTNQIINSCSYGFQKIHDHQAITGGTATVLSFTGCAMPKPR